MTLVGASKLNTHPCTDAETDRNWQIQSDLNVLITDTIEGGGAGDTYKVAVNATDVTNTTYDYLHAKINNHGAYVTDGSVIVSSDTITNTTERFYWTAESIADYDANLIQILQQDNAVLHWVEAATFTDTFSVKVTSTDSQENYLHQSFHLNDTYFPNADILIATATEGGAGTDQKERPFVDVSIISGWHETAFRVLSIVNNTTSWMTTATFATNFFAGLTFYGLTFNSGTSTISSGYHLIRGLVKGDVTADDTTFVIDNVIPLAHGADPVSGVAATEITVQNVQKETFEDNAPLTAIYDGTNWEVLLVERYRAVRGTWVSGTTTLTVNTIVVLDSGLDPRADPTSTTETISVTNVADDTYSSGDKVYADWNAKDNVWEARPKGSGSPAKIGKADATIPARSGTTVGSGTVSIWSISGSTLSDTGANETWCNIAATSVASGVFIQAKEISSGQMVIDFEECG